MDDRRPPLPAPSPEVPLDQGLSLTDLSAAFAQMLGSGQDPYDEGPAEGFGQPASTHLGLTPPGLGLPGDPPPLVNSAADCDVSPRSILEAMLFVGSPAVGPLTAAQVASLMRGVRVSEVDDLVRELNNEYRANHCPYEILSEGAGYRLALRAEYLPLQEKLKSRVRQSRLSPSAVEVLALVAYRGPLTADEIRQFRGVPCGALLSQLVRRQLLSLEREASEPPARACYRTTPRFLAVFGLQSLDDLPRDHDPA